MQIFSLGDNLHEMSNFIFRQFTRNIKFYFQDKNKKQVINSSSDEFLLAS